LARVPPALVEPLKAQTARYRPVRAVGYWRSAPPIRLAMYAHFPDPKALVCPGWRQAEQSLICAYLRAGGVYAQWRGLSHCRFACGIDSQYMGSRCLTDGSWVWPEGLVHYVEVHHVRLPEEFIQEVQQRDWQIPCGEALPCYQTQGDPDYDYWISWAQDARSLQREGL
jgi:hypothetical protein